MPDINIDTLDEIINVTVQSMTQNTPNSCGAYALIAATGAFGRIPTPCVINYVNDGPQAVNREEELEVNDDFPHLCMRTYIITGILNPPVANVAVDPELNQQGNVYNSPAAMANVISQFDGYDVPQINITADGFALLGLLYPNERARCELIVGEENVNVDAEAYIPPAADQTCLVCVRLNIGGGLHWLAQGSDGNCYDPADGSTNNAWQPQDGGMGDDYTFTGLWIVVTLE